MQLFELLCMSLVCLDKYPVGCIKDTIIPSYFIKLFDFACMHSTKKLKSTFHVFMMVMRGYELTNERGMNLDCNNLIRVVAIPTFTRKC